MPNKRKSYRPMGRPPKFAGPSRVVTLTLPEATLESLSKIDEDRARAIVWATDQALASIHPLPSDAVELLAVTRSTAVITVPFSQPLCEIAGLNLIKILPARYLLIIEPGTPLTSIEVAIQDKLDGAGLEERDRNILAKLLAQLRACRRSQRTTKGELILLSI